MAFIATVTDNLDGTATVVVNAGGSSAGYFVHRAEQAVSSLGSYAVPSSPSQGSGLTGNTTTTFSGSGYFRWKLVAASGGATLAGPEYLPIFEGGDSVYDRCLVMVKDRIAALDLPSVTSGHVYLREIPVLEDGTMETPCVVVSDYGQQEEVRSGTNGQDDYAYPVSVLFIESQSPQGDEEEVRRRNLRTREAIHRAIDHIAPWDSRVPEVYQCEVRPAEVISPEWEQEYGVRASGLVVNCIARQNRGTTIGSVVTLT